MKDKMNHITVALLVFFLLATAFLWATGNLHIGPAANASKDAGGHATHGAAEDSCTGCEEEVEDDCAGCEDEPADACAGCPEEDQDPAGEACTDCEESHDGHADEVAHTGDEEDGHKAEDDGHNHPKVDSHTDPNALFAINCEHDCPIVECDECRYEVGVVKVSGDICKDLIETEKTSVKSISDQLTVTGTVQLDQTKVVEVASAGKGRVIRIEKQLGEKVKAGDAIAVIHSADMGLAKAEYLETLARLELARATFEREKSLYDQKASSQADFLKSQSELRSAEACFAADEKKLNLFGMTAEQIAAIENEKKNGNFAELTLRAPADGTIIEQNIIVGQLVDTTDSLYKVADLSNVWVWCDLYEKNLAEVHRQFTATKGNVKAQLRVRAYDETFAGTVDLITSKLDATTRTVRMRLQVPNENLMLKPGMFAHVAIPVGKTTDGLMVPQTAVMTDEDKAFVFQHLKDDYWLRQDVVTGKKSNGHVEIVEGLAANAVIVTKGAFMFKSDVLREKMGAGCAH